MDCLLLKTDKLINLHLRERHIWITDKQIQARVSLPRGWLLIALQKVN